MPLKLIPSKELQRPATGGITYLLEPFVPEPPSVVLLSGETSAGKTVLSRTIAVSLAENQELIPGLKPIRPAKVIYVDLESQEQILCDHLDKIGRPDNLAFILHLSGSLKLPDALKELSACVKDFAAEVVIIDPLLVAWPVDDENNNSEADFQVSTLKEWAKEMNVTLILMHNMGEGRPKEKYRARGATSRLDRVDMALNYTDAGDTLRQLKIVKSRYPGTMGYKHLLRFGNNLDFQAVDGAEIFMPTSASHRLKERFVELVKSGVTKRSTLVETTVAEGLGKENLGDKALSDLVQSGVLKHSGWGVYELNQKT